MRNNRKPIKRRFDSFWNVSLQQLWAELDSSEKGLSDQEARARLLHCGFNVIADPHPVPGWLQFFVHFCDPLVLMLLVASFFSMLTGDVASFVIIIVIVLLSVILDFFQERQAEEVVNTLRSKVAMQAEVLRDGVKKIIPVTKIVPGDIIYLSAGSLVPADGRLITAKGLLVNQAMLTGESYPVEKLAAEFDQTMTDLFSANNAVLMGTSVISGTGVFLTIHTGRKTQIGQLAGTLATKPPPTRFAISIREFGVFLMRIAIFMLLFALLINTLLHRPLLQSFLFALALAVALTPELLPMIMTITLSRGALNLAKQQAIVKHLPVMYDIGAMDILCTDKTGTLTEAKIRLMQTLNSTWQDSEKVREFIWLNSFFSAGIKSPLDDAILATAKVDSNRWRKMDEAPFDFNRRCVSVLLKKEGAHFLIVKGAPEDILKHCRYYDENGVAMDLSEAKRKACITKFESLGKEGLRVIGVAYRELALTQHSITIVDETSLVFAGFAVFLDPPKADAAKALQALTASGIQVKVLSGDNEHIAHHLCQLLGIHTDQVLIGEQIEKVTDEALQIQVKRAQLFCRVNPQQKNRIILALKASGHIVGYIGDGINDASALRSADIGISVDGATDVARDAADIILLKRSLFVIHNAVIQGRRTVANVSKYILMAGSTNFADIFSMAVSTLFLPFLPMSAIQILLSNLLYDIVQMGLPFDYVDEDVLRRPIQWNIAFIRRFMFIVGPVSSLFDFLTFYLLLRWFGSHEALFHSGWFLESMVLEMVTIFCIRTRKRLFTSWPHPIIMALITAVTGTVILLPYTMIGKWFDLTPLPLFFFVYVIIVTLIYFVLLEIVRHCFYKYYTPS